MNQNFVLLLVIMLSVLLGLICVLCKHITANKFTSLPSRYFNIESFSQRIQENQYYKIPDNSVVCYNTTNFNKVPVKQKKIKQDVVENVIAAYPNYPNISTLGGGGGAHNPSQNTGSASTSGTFTSTGSGSGGNNFTAPYLDKM